MGGRGSGRKPAGAPPSPRRVPIPCRVLPDSLGRLQAQALSSKAAAGYLSGHLENLASEEFAIAISRDEREALRLLLRCGFRSESVSERTIEAFSSLWRKLELEP